MWPLFLTLILVASTVAHASPTEVEVGAWYEIPSSDMAQVQPDHFSSAGLGTPAAAMRSWNGGAYDQSRNRLLIFGGGHSNGGDNSLYYFDLNTKSWGTSYSVGSGPLGYYPNRYAYPEYAYSLSAGTNLTLEPYPDGSPVVWHTYGGMVYIPEKDEFFAAGSSTHWRLDGGIIRGTPIRTAAWSFANNSWKVSEADTENAPFGTNTRSAYDPLLNRVFVAATNYGLGVLDVTTGVWDNSSKLHGWYSVTKAAAVIDPLNRIFVQIRSNLVSYGVLAASGTILNAVVITTGDAPPGNAEASGGAMGAVWDPILKKIVVYDGGTSLYSLDTSSVGTEEDPWVWEKHPATDGTKATESGLNIEGLQHGIFGRFQYDEEFNLYIVVHSTIKNVWLRRLTDDRRTTITNH